MLGSERSCSTDRTHLPGHRSDSSWNWSSRSEHADLRSCMSEVLQSRPLNTIWSELVWTGLNRSVDLTSVPPSAPGTQLTLTHCRLHLQLVLDGLQVRPAPLLTHHGELDHLQGVRARPLLPGLAPTYWGNVQCTGCPKKNGDSCLRVIFTIFHWHKFSVSD